VRGWILATMWASACPSSPSSPSPSGPELVRVRVETQADGITARSVEVKSGLARLSEVSTGCRKVDEPAPVDLQGDTLEISVLGQDWTLPGTRHGHQGKREVTGDVRWRTVPARRSRSWGARTDDLLRVGGALQAETIAVGPLGQAHVAWSGDYAPQSVGVELQVGQQRVRCFGDDGIIDVPATLLMVADPEVWLVGERMRARQMPDGTVVVGQTELAVPLQVNLRQAGLWVRSSEQVQTRPTPLPSHAEHGPSTQRRRTRDVRGG